VPHSQDIHSFRSDLIDDAVIAFEDFPDRLILVLRYDPASMGKLAKTVSALNKLIDEALGIVGLILCYMLKNLPKAEY
jgi:hypothetical protein